VSTLDATSVSGPVPVRRIEVITGAGGRRRWSEAEKAAIVAEATAPGAVVSQVARRHGLTPQQVFTWRRERTVAAGRPSDGEFPSFAPLVVEAAPPAVEVEIPGAVVRVPPGADADTVRVVIAALRGTR